MLRQDYDEAFKILHASSTSRTIQLLMHESDNTKMHPSLTMEYKKIT